MLRELAAHSSRHDAATRTVTLEVSAGGGKVRGERGTALLDARGRVVGVDVEPTAPSRVIVLAGRHEDVASTRDARLSVSRDARGEVASVVVHDVDPPR